VAKRRSTACVCAEIVPARVVGHQRDDVGFFLCENLTDKLRRHSKRAVFFDLRVSDLTITSFPCSVVVEAASFESIALASFRSF
jgi:hypothetical protein